MKTKIIFYTVLCFFIVSCSVAKKTQNNGKTQSKLFEQYKNDPANSILPDFSYVGYHNGNKNIPKINNYKVFNVTDFGAIPDDNLSDKNAIQKAIDAANKNGSGIVFFPKGRFLVNEVGDGNSSIISKGSNIIFRGSGSGVGGTELYMKNNLPPKNPEQMWTVPPLFIFTCGGKDQKISTVNASAKKGDFTLKLSSATNLKKGDWILLKMLNNDPALIQEEMAPHHADPSWTSLVKDGVDFKIYYQV